MKKRLFKLIVTLFILLVVSCNEPETVVTNYVHPNGSVLRTIVMRSGNEKAEERFVVKDLQIPFDSTWTVKDSVELSSKKEDSIWVRRAEKLFKNVDELNLSYKNDSGPNRIFSRETGFKKCFKWFNTEYRFSERIDKELSFGYPVSKFLNSEELLYFYSPESLKSVKENGSDSLKYKALSDSVKHKTDYWTSKNMVSEWIGEFSKLTKGTTDEDMSFQSLKAREDEFATIVEKDDNQLDSLWKNGILLREFVGEENALKYKSEADSALTLATNKLLAEFREYSVRIVMPGKLIGTNGFIDSSQILMWPVKADYFMTEPYEMWAESKVPNMWAWIVSGLFLIFVMTGVIVRIIKKG
jgi:hypothetical protein